MVAGGDGGGVADSDRWALEYIGANYVRGIIEALDDDASGFITVKEANNFTHSRPLDWRWVFETVLRFPTCLPGPAFRTG
jgi:hypothetical protein